jgi:hypothetical protein
MSALLRARISSFFAGMAVAGVYGVYALRKDLVQSHDHLLTQVGAHPKRFGPLAKLCIAQLLQHPLLRAAPPYFALVMLSSAPVASQVVETHDTLAVRVTQLESAVEQLRSTQGTLAQQPVS